MSARYSHAGMEVVLARRFEHWVTIEVIWALAQTEVALDAVERAQIGALIECTRSIERRAWELEKETGHDVQAMIAAIMERFQSGSAPTRAIHYGLTSSDIVDSAWGLVLSEAAHALHEEIWPLRKALRHLTGNLEKSRLVARTHGRPAELISAAERVRGWDWECKACSARLFEHTKKRVGRLSGSVGLNKYADRNVERRALAELWLESCDEGASQVVRRALFLDFYHSCLVLPMLLVERIALTLRLMAREGLISEGAANTRVGSSSMPHKKNPIGLENLCGQARIVRCGYQALAEDCALWEERDISHSCVEREVLERSMLLTAYSIERLSAIIRNLVVDKEAIATEVEKYRGECGSQERMHKLIREGMGRLEAHKRIKEENA